MTKKKQKKDLYAEREAGRYINPIASREYILEIIKEHGAPTTKKQLIKSLELTTKDQQEALRRRLLAMVRDGQLLLNRRGAYGLINKMELIKGFVIGHKDGYGFVVSDDSSEDIFLSARQMRTVFPGDEVLVRVSGVDGRGRKEGFVVEVVTRNTNSLVGRMVIEDGVKLVEPSNQRITQDIFVPDDFDHNAKSGQMVVVEITDFPTHTSRAHGKVTEILGDHMAPGMEIDVAIRNHDLPNEWSKKLIKEAKSFPVDVTDDMFAGRKDLRNKPFVTIDGADARDFDDAVVCEEREKGGWVLYVAIADVSNYVTLNSELDKEAYKRGTSVYFPGRVIPMLPEELSNELCSLKPNVNRLTMVCEMAVSQTGRVERFRFYEAVIKSHARLTYDEVYAMVKQDDKGLQKKHKSLLPKVQNLFSLYESLFAARKRRGAIDFDMPETKIIFDDTGKIDKIVSLVRNDAHRLIEECMLCANICAAKFLLKHEAPCLYRVHDGPQQAKLFDLKKFLGELGLKLPGAEEPTPKDYSKLLKSVDKRPDKHIIQMLLLRSLSQAMYYYENKGHFGLAFAAYAHFTSPIRRYPDLLVHRSIKNVIQKNQKELNRDLDLEAHGEHLSMTERRADDATRESVDWLKCEYMMDKVGQTFDGVISSVTSFGFFVELKDIFVEGLVHISLLKNDYYTFSPAKHALVGERSGASYHMGDTVKIVIARVDLDQRQIDFVLANGTEDTKPKKKKRDYKKKKVKSK